MDTSELKERQARGEKPEDICARAIGFAEACESERDLAREGALEMSATAATRLKDFQDLMVQHTSLNSKIRRIENLCLDGEKLLRAGFFGRLGENYRRRRKEFFHQCQVIAASKYTGNK